jgi:hypothetical protein
MVRTEFKPVIQKEFLNPKTKNTPNDNNELRLTFFPRPISAFFPRPISEDIGSTSFSNPPHAIICGTSHFLFWCPVCRVSLASSRTVLAFRAPFEQTINERAGNDKNWNKENF